MLACDSALHRFTAPTDSFRRHFRSDSYLEHQDINPYGTMYTEGEPKEKIRKLESLSPSHTSPVQQPGAQALEVPPQLSPEVLPPASAAQTPPRASLPQPTSPSGKLAVSASAISTTASFSPPTQFSDGKQEHLHQHQHHHQQNLQQHGYKDADNTEGIHERGHNSDSDSSSVNGITDGNRRFREFVPEEQKDNIYWEKRRKNNEAARKSREKRRMHDMVLEGRITSLEDDNSRLRRELLDLKKKFNLPEGQVYYDRDSDVKEAAIPRAGNNLSPSSVNHMQGAHHNTPVNKLASSNMPYSSPPPLLAMGEPVPMGVALYSGVPNTGMPYYLPEASRGSQEGTIKPVSSSITTGHLHHQQISNQHHHHPAYPMDLLKDEPIEVGEIRIRERSNSSVERRPCYRLDPSETSLLRRGSVGNYAQYRAPLSPPSIQTTHHSYVNTQVNPANHAHFLHRAYENNPLFWSQRSPVSSHSSDDNYDEPLQLTVRRDSNVSIHSNNPAEDNSSRECDSNAASGEKTSISISPPASSFPLKLRHKLPTHDISYPKEMFPNISPSPVTATQPSFPPHPFINGMPHLSDLTLTQGNSLSLVKAESPCPYSNRKDSRSGSRRNPTETKYLDPKYLERRRRNNEAARKCRENRKTLTKIREAKSDYLENENSKLRDELNSLQEEMKQLRELIEKKRLEQGIKEEPNVES